MNKHLYRIAFNRKTNAPAAIAEISRSGSKGKGSASAVTRIASLRLRLTHLAIVIAALVGSLHMVQAQVVAYRNVPGNQQPTVLQTGNGIPLVNIQTPSAQGVSRNLYSQFDVDSRGVILNNARNNALTQLGGYVQGNPWLATGSARVILNEINSSDPSKLHGYIEVAGARAHVIIANPSGLSINGSGFINASRATLTTGMPSMQGGNLDAYRVHGGSIDIGGGGLDASNTDFTDLMSRAVRIDGGLWAKDLKISTGINTISADHQTVTANSGASGPEPRYAIDMAQLGGMYAGHIFLVGTERQLGMFNAGNIAAKDFIVSADGRIENQGSISASGQIDISAGGFNNQGGQLQAGGNATLQLGAAELDNSGGLMRSNGAVIISAGDILNANTQADNLGIQAQTITLNTANLDNQSGAIRANTDVLVSSAGHINNGGGQLSAGQTLALIDAGSGEHKTLAISNADGSLIAGSQLSIDSAAMSGDGKVLSLGDLALKLDADYLHSGTTQADGNVSITTAGTLSNNGQLLASQSLSTTAAVIDNQSGGHIIANHNQLQAEHISNRGLIDGSNTTLRGTTIDNLGGARIYGDHLAIAATTLNNSGGSGDSSAPVIAARERLDLGVATINNSEHALIYSAGDLYTGSQLDANGHASGQGEAINNSSATIAADGHATLSHKRVNNLNAHLETTLEYSTGDRIVRFRLDGSPDLLDGSTVRLVNRSNGHVLAPGDWRNMNDDANYRLVLPSATYPFARYGAGFYQMPYTPGGSSGGGGDREPNVYPEVYAYPPTDPVWAIMGVAPPVSATLIGPAPQQPGREQCNGDSCYYVPGSPAETAAWQAAMGDWEQAHGQQQASYQALNRAVVAFNNDLNGRMQSAWTIYDGTEQIARTKVLRSDPGMIQIGGHLRLNGDTVNNANSQIIAGGDLSGTQVSNTGLQGSQTVTSVGQASYTFLRSHAVQSDDRRYESRDYQGQTLQTSFPLDITPTDGRGAQQDKTIKSTPSKAADGDGKVVRTSNPELSLPDSALYRPGNERYLIATDLQFTNYRNWLSSDAMLNQLQFDPATVLKRLGDGYYEQQLVQQQIQKAIGQRYLGDYSSNEAQYQALMAAGVELAQRFDYTLGIALTAEQMAQLTADIVWLVKQTVTLADGSQEEVLVPQVYLRAKRSQVTGDGTLIAADNIQFKTAGDILNNGTIAANHGTQLAANNIANFGGRISGQDTQLQAQNDILNLGSIIDGGNSVTAVAGRDIIHRSTTVETVNATTSGSNIDSAALVIATGKGGVVTQVAGRDIHIDAAQLSADTIAMVAQRDLTLGTVHETSHEQIDWDSTPAKAGVAGLLSASAQNSAERSHDNAIGSTINGEHISLSAGRDLSSRAASVTAEQDLSVVAGGDLLIATDTSSAAARDRHSHSQAEGWFADKSTITDDASGRIEHIGSSFSGDTVQLAVGGQLSILGSDVVATKDISLAAQGDITIAAAMDSGSSRHERIEITEGLMGSGAGVSIGIKEQTHSDDNRYTRATAATLGSVDGKVSILAGNSYTQTGSKVLVPSGDISIAAKQVTIEAAQNTSISTIEDSYKQSGITVALTGAVVSALQTVGQMDEAASKTKDPRMQALAAATAGMAVAGAANSVVDAAASGKGSSGIGIAITVGGSENESKTEQRSTQQQGSQVLAGGNVSISASGDQQRSDITIQASDINAGNKLSLSADHDISLLGGENTDEQHSTRSSNSFGVGLAVEFGQGGAAFGVTVNAAGSRGNTDGRDAAQVMSRLQGGQQVELTSGNDTSIKGALVSGKQVVVNVGNDLTIESLQDTSTYASKDQNFSANVTAGAGFSGSASVGQSKVSADFASVAQQSGIEAGDGGFEINVNGNTNLKGGKIASTDKAITDGKNRLDTDTLTTSSVENRSQYQAESISVGTSGAGMGSSSGGEHSSTNASISAARITLNDQVQQDKTGLTAEQTIAKLDQTARTGQDSSNSLLKNWNGEELRQDVQAQAQITQAFGQQTAKAIGDYASEQYKKAIANGDAEGAKNWAEGGAYRVAAHTVAGALSGGVAGALGAGLSAATIPEIAGAIKDLGLPDVVTKGLIAAAGSAVGAAAGGLQGAAAGMNQTVNNYLKHDEIEQLTKARKACPTGSGDSSACGEVKRLEALDQQRDMALTACTGNTSSACDGVRQDVRQAAADIIRYGNAKTNLDGALDKLHTINQADGSMSGVDHAAGVGVGIAITTVDAAKALAKGLGTLLLGISGDQAAREQIESGAVQSFATLGRLAAEPELLAQVLNNASAEQRNALATAYENGDAFAIGKLAGNILAIVAPVPIGIIGKVGTALEDAAKAANAAKKGSTAEDVAAGAKLGGENTGKVVEGAVPNAGNAVIDPQKVTGYALNPDHPVGGNKAVVFDSALGYNQTNAGDLIAKVQKGVTQNPATLGKADQFGQRYTVDMPITGPNGNTVTVRTGWILDPGSTVPRLTTIYVK